MTQLEKHLQNQHSLTHFNDSDGNKVTVKMEVAKTGRIVSYEETVTYSPEKLAGIWSKLADRLGYGMS